MPPQYRPIMDSIVAELQGKIRASITGKNRFQLVLQTTELKTRKTLNCALCSG